MFKKQKNNTASTTPAPQRPTFEKKSETLEVRLPYTKKREFMAKCVANDETASHAIRGFVSNYVSRRDRRNYKRKAFSVFGLSLFGLCILASTVAMQPPHQTSAQQNTIFSAMDTNKDGYWTATDAKDETRSALFALLEKSDTNEDGRLSLKELTELPTFQFSLKQDDIPKKLKPKTFISLNLDGTQSFTNILSQLQEIPDLSSLNEQALLTIAQKISESRLN